MADSAWFSSTAKDCPFYLQRHVAGDIAPLAITGAAAQPADADLIDRARRQVCHHYAPRLREDARVLPVAVAGLNLHLIITRVGDGRDAQGKFFRAFIQNREDGGLGQRSLGAVLIRGRVAG